MRKEIVAFLIACTAFGPLLVVAAGVAPGNLDSKTGMSREWAKWFVGASSVQKSADAPFPLYAVTAASGQTNGWIFRTDQVPPVVKGKRGQIGVMVGLGRDGLIKGVEVLDQREDAAWFNRLKPGFYAQFAGKSGSRQGVKVDTVSGATVSSRAITEDVFLSCQAVMALPGVSPLLKARPAGAQP